MPTPASNDHCVVFLTDRIYLPGTRCAMASWIQVNGPAPFVVLCRDNETLADPFLRRHCHRIEAVDLETYASIQTYAKRRSQRYAGAFAKFEAFRDFGFARNIYLDSDLLCLRPTPRLLAPASAAMLAAPETGFRKTRAYKGHASEINSGVLAIDRSVQGSDTVRRLQEIARTSPGRGGYNAGDQGIINKWIHRDAVALETLSGDYNLIKKDYADASGLDTCRILHFADRKPWLDRRRRDGSLWPVTSLEQLWLDQAGRLPDVL